MHWCNNMITYDQWSNVTMSGTLEVLCSAVRERIQIDGLLFVESPEEQAIWQANCPLPVYLQTVIEGRVFALNIMVWSQSS
jgi:hypothetical protein